MKKESLQLRITADPNILCGKPVIRGLRISVSQILASLSNNVSTDDLLNDYPELEKEDIFASLAYASEVLSKISKN